MKFKIIRRNLREEAQQLLERFSRGFGKAERAEGDPQPLSSRILPSGAERGRLSDITGTTNRSVKSYTPADIASVEHRERPDGSGDIVIQTNSLLRTNNSVSQFKLALLGIPNVKQVAQQVLALHAQRSAG